MPLRSSLVVSRPLLSASRFATSSSTVSLFDVHATACFGMLIASLHSCFANIVKLHHGVWRQGL